MPFDTPSSPATYKLTPVVVLTGASSGIGRATALAFAGEGADLVLAAREREALDTVAAECSEAGARVLVQPTDVTDPEAVRRLAAAALERFGQIDVWINNVGIGAIGLFDRTPIEAHRRVVEANLLGHMHGAHAVLPHFRARGCGTLINMISVGGWIPAPYAAAYSASKFGLRGFSEALRAELAGLPNVHVCEVYPTFVDTPGVTHGANYSDHRLSPPPGLVDPRRVAQVLLSLARKPRRATYVGIGARSGIWAHAVAPNLVARMMMWLTERSLERAEPRPRTDGNLFAPSAGHAIDGGFGSSKLAGRPSAVAGLAATALGAAALAGWWALRRRRADGVRPPALRTPATPAAAPPR